MMLKSLEMELEDDMKVPPLCYEKSFLRKIPSIIMEAHESMVSLKNEETTMKPDSNLFLMHTSNDHMQQQQSPSVHSFNPNPSQEKHQSKQNQSQQ